MANQRKASKKNISVIIERDLDAQLLEIANLRDSDRSKIVMLACQEFVERSPEHLYKGWEANWKKRKAFDQTKPK